MRDLFLIIHFLGLAMAVGTGFAGYFLIYSASKLEPAERSGFLAKTAILMRMGQIGLGILILTGFYLMTPFWSTLLEMPMLVAKLAFVALQVIMITIVSLMVKRAKESNDPTIMLRIRPLRMLNFVIGLTIVTLAVLTFH